MAEVAVVEGFVPPDDGHDHCHYGWSTLQSLLRALAGTEGAGRTSGALPQPGSLHRYALAAGFTKVEVLPIEEDPWRFYRLIHQPT